ncbi:MAG: hypothetical protein WC740_07840 [Verrucomicrobiia bacterium]
MNDLSQRMMTMRSQLPAGLVCEMAGVRVEPAEPVRGGCPHRVAWLDDASPRNMCRDCGAPLERPPMVAVEQPEYPRAWE